MPSVSCVFMFLPMTNLPLKQLEERSDRDIFFQCIVIFRKQTIFRKQVRIILQRNTGATLKFIPVKRHERLKVEGPS